MPKLNWTTIKRPIIALSPMADMTDSAFCRVVKEMASPVVFREMVSSDAIVHGNDKTLGMAKIHDDERPIVQQIFGSNPERMAEAAKIIERDHHPEGIDINMGCPVYRLVNSFNGAALMKKPELATEIIKKVKEAVTVPVSVKIRAGWDDPKECLEFAKIIEAAGADLITIHGRTKKQGYSGVADWDLIREMREQVSIPVLANGDIFTPQLAFEALEQTKCEGIMIARGALGNPWIFSQIEEILAGKEPTRITLEERVRTVKRHAQLHIEQYGERGIVTFRKHLVWYFKSLPTKEYRPELHTVESLEAMNVILDKIAADPAIQEAASRRDAVHPLAATRMKMTK